MAFSEASPLPMRFPIAGMHIDIGIWPNGWRFLTATDGQRFAEVSEPERSEWLRAFDAHAAALAER